MIHFLSTLMGSIILLGDDCRERFLLHFPVPDVRQRAVGREFLGVHLLTFPFTVLRVEL